MRLVFLAVICCLAFAADLPVHVRNFAKVSNHLYRGGAPGPEGLKELVAAHVVLDIDLREPHEGTATEAAEAKKLGLQYINVPLSEFWAPSENDVKKILALIEADRSGPVFVHCRRGKDRTGTIVACYRIETDNWTNRRALQEANSYGMSYAERRMRSFIMRFKPVPLDLAASGR